MSGFAVTGYEISIWIHITAVIVGFGATFAQVLFFRVAMAGDPRHLPFVHEVGLKINRYLANPGLLLIILTGLYQTSDGNWKLGSFWISGTFTIAIVLGALIGAFLIPSEKKLAALATADIAAAGPAGAVTLSAEYEQRARTVSAVYTACGVLVVIAVFLMVVKPGA